MGTDLQWPREGGVERGQTQSGGGQELHTAGPEAAGVGKELRRSPDQDQWELHESGPAAVMGGRGRARGWMRGSVPSCPSHHC